VAYGGDRVFSMQKNPENPWETLKEKTSEISKEMDKSNDLYQASPFWDNLNKQAMEQLENGGFENFKRTVNMKYFNWNALTIVAHQLHPVLFHWFRSIDTDIFKSKFKYRDAGSGVKYKTFNPLTAQIYKLYLCLLHNYVSTFDKQNLLDRLTEPSIGNPYLVDYRNKKVSQDLCNSIHEFYSATKVFADPSAIKNVTELGAGYGRLAYVFLKTLPNCTYTIVDLPVALVVAQEYLSSVFKDEKIFKFRPFNSYEDIKTEFESSRIRFVSANQIEKLPNKSADLFLNISSLHEMTYAQITNYLQEIDRLTHGFFYTKQWRRSIAKENGFVIRQGEYPIPKNWKTIFDHQHPIQRMFFEANYQI
jgi:putative sugar O-methyltransferase